MDHWARPLSRGTQLFGLGNRIQRVKSKRLTAEAVSTSSCVVVFSSSACTENPTLIVKWTGYTELVILNLLSMVTRTVDLAG